MADPYSDARQKQSKSHFMQYDDSNTSGTGALPLNETNESIQLNQDDNRYRPGLGTSNLMIYSTLAAAFPYAHKAPTSTKHDDFYGDKDETP